MGAEERLMRRGTHALCISRPGPLRVGDRVRLDPRTVGDGNGQADPSEADLDLKGTVLDVDSETRGAQWCAVQWDGEPPDPCGVVWFEYASEDLIRCTTPQEVLSARGGWWEWQSGGGCYVWRYEHTADCGFALISDVEGERILNADDPVQVGWYYEGEDGAVNWDEHPNLLAGMKAGERWHGGAR